jgi:hypothetical protein
MNHRRRRILSPCLQILQALRDRILASPQVQGLKRLVLSVCIIRRPSADLYQQAYPCSSINRPTRPENYILRISCLEDMRARDPQRCMPQLSAASALNCATQRPINDLRCRVLPETTTAVRYVGSRRQCREPTIASARRSAGLRSVLRCRTVASWPSILPSLPAHMAHVTCGRDIYRD